MGGPSRESNSPLHKGTQVGNDRAEGGKAPPPPPPPDQIPPGPAPPPLPGGGRSRDGHPARSRQGSPALWPLALAGALVLGLAVMGVLAYWGLGLLRGGEELSLERMETADRVDSQGRALNPTGTFDSDTPAIYVSLNLSGASRDTVLTSRWYREPLQGEEELLASSSNEVQPGDSLTFFRQVAPAGGWEGGAYRVELSAGEEPLATARFWIQETTGTREAPTGHSGNGAGQLTAADLDRLHQDLGEWLYTDRGHRSFVLLRREEVPGLEEYEATYGKDDLVWAYGIESSESQGVTVLLGIPHGETLARISLQRLDGSWTVTSYENYGPGAP